MAYLIGVIVDELKNNDIQYISNLSKLDNLKSGELIMIFNKEYNTIEIYSSIDRNYYNTYTDNYIIFNLSLFEIICIILSVLNNDYLNKIDGIKNDNCLYILCSNYIIQIILRENEFIDYESEYTIEFSQIRTQMHNLKLIVENKINEFKWFGIVY